MANEKAGQIVWHDHFSTNRARSIEFYGQVASWTFVTEHATDFAWGGGEKDFVLAMSDGEAGAGFIEASKEVAEGWIPYVEVPDVDRSAALAEKLGGQVLKQPFSVPGVGRNSLLLDPQGARIGISQSLHGFPVPTRQFGQETYLSGSHEFPDQFYSELFDWAYLKQNGNPTGFMRHRPTQQTVAVHIPTETLRNCNAIWAPALRVGNPDNARAAAEPLGACLVSRGPVQAPEEAYTVLKDPNGVFFALIDDGVRPF